MELLKNNFFLSIDFRSSLIIFGALVDGLRDKYQSNNPDSDKEPLSPSLPTGKKASHECHMGLDAEIITCLSIFSALPLSKQLI